MNRETVQVGEKLRVKVKFCLDFDSQKVSRWKREVQVKDGEKQICFHFYEIL